MCDSLSLSFWPFTQRWENSTHHKTYIIHMRSRWWPPQVTGSRAPHTALIFARAGFCVTLIIVLQIGMRGVRVPRAFNNSKTGGQINIYILGQLPAASEPLVCVCLRACVYQIFRWICVCAHICNMIMLLWCTPDRNRFDELAWAIECVCVCAQVQTTTRFASAPVGLLHDLYAKQSKDSVRCVCVRVTQLHRQVWLMRCLVSHFIHLSGRAHTSSSSNLWL